jgi:hypothetical protein
MKFRRGDVTDKEDVVVKVQCSYLGFDAVEMLILAS